MSFPRVVYWVETTTLIDTGTHVSTIKEGFCNKFGLAIHPLGGIATSRVDRGISIPYKEYVDAHLLITDIPQYNEDKLCLVILDNKYRVTVPIYICTMFINYLISFMTGGLITG